MNKLVGFLTKKFHMSNIFRRPIRGLFSWPDSDRTNMPISTNLSVTGRWPQYNGKISNIGQPTLQICCTDQIFFQSSTSRPFYASRRRDSSACGIPTLIRLAHGVQPETLY